MTYQLIETKTLATAATSIEFTNIPQDGTDLLVLLSLRTARGGELDFLGMRLGNTTIDTGNNYPNRLLQGSGSSTNSSANSVTDRVIVGPVSASGATANTFGNAATYIVNYTGSQNKSVSSDAVSEHNATAAYQQITTSLWSNSSPVARLIVFGDVGSDLAIGSTISLYKITRGTSNGVVVS